MKYIGKLYGRFDARKYFDTGKTSEDWDAMEQKIKELEEEVERLKDIAKTACRLGRSQKY